MNLSLELAYTILLLTLDVSGDLCFVLFRQEGNIEEAEEGGELIDEQMHYYSHICVNNANDWILQHILVY